MKQVRLVCDWCPGPVKLDAVALLSLSNGRETKGALTRDLCKKHVKQAKKLLGRTTPAEPIKRTRARRHDYGVLGAKFMRFAPKEPFHATALNKHFKLSRGTVFKIANYLVKEGKLKSTGAGSSRKLSRV